VSIIVVISPPKKRISVCESLEVMCVWESLNFQEREESKSRFDGVLLKRSSLMGVGQSGMICYFFLKECEKMGAYRSWQRLLSPFARNKFLL